MSGSGGLNLHAQGDGQSSCATWMPGMWDVYFWQYCVSGRHETGYEQVPKTEAKQVLNRVCKTIT